jgi:1,4-dihydroxy-2-naphthoyl-CoA hydrolase
MSASISAHCTSISPADDDGLERELNQDELEQQCGAATGVFPGVDTWGESLGMEVTLHTAEKVVARIQADQRHHQPYGILHGGVYCSIVEGVASYGAGMLARDRGMAGVVGVSNSTDFLRSHSEGELIATGIPLHVGRSAQIWRVEIHRASDEKLVASGQVRFHILTELPNQRKK